MGDAAEVDNDSLDTVALAFDLGLEPLHLVSVEGVLDIAANVDSSHGCGIARGNLCGFLVIEIRTMTVTLPDDTT